MINPHLKNQRTGFHQDLFHRSSHYSKLIKTKSKIDNGWAHDSLKLPHKNTWQKSLEMCRAEENLRLMKKIVNIDRRPMRYQSEGSESTTKKSLKNQYKQYRRQLAISEENIKILKKIANAKSGLSKKKMDQFNCQMTKYSRLVVTPKDKVDIIDNLFFNSYRIGMMRDRVQSKAEKNRSKFNRKKFNSRSDRKDWVNYS